MKKIINTFFQVSSERLKSPLIFSFIMSLLAFNWKSIFTLFLSDKKIEERISYITDNFNNIDLTLYYPLYVSLGYVLLLPYFNWLIEKLVNYAKISRKENLLNEYILDLKGKQKIAIEERKYEQEKAGSVEISELNSKIEELTLSNEEKQKTIGSLKIDYNLLDKERTRLEQLIINIESADNVEFNVAEKYDLDNEYDIFLNTELSTYFENVATEVSQFKSMPKNTDAIIIEKFIYSDLIKKIDDVENQRVYYSLTKKGKYFWKKYVLSKTILTKYESETKNDLPF